MENVTLLKKAIPQFPTIKHVIGVDKILLLAQKDSASPLAHYIRRSLPDESKVKQLMSEFEKNPKHGGVLILLDHHLNCLWTMKHLDDCLSEIKDCDQIDVFVRHITDSNSFWQGYCEIEVAANIRRTFGKNGVRAIIAEWKICGHQVLSRL